MTVKFGASQTNKKNKDLAHRTFQEAERIWEDNSYKLLEEFRLLIG